MQGDSDRESLRARVLKAVEAGGEAMAQTASVTTALDTIDAAIEELATQQQTAAAMMIAGVGASDTSPEEASKALASFSRLGELIIEMRESAALLRMRNEGAYRVASKGSAAASRYVSGV